MIDFDLKTIFVFIIGFLNLILGGIVLYRNRRAEVNISFGIMTVLVGLWSIAAFIFRAIPSDESAYFFGFVLYAVAALLPVSFFIMTLSFPPYSLLSKKLILFLIIEAIFLIWFSSTPRFVIQEMSVESGERILLWGDYYFIYVLHHTLLFFAGYIVLFQKFIKAEGIEKRQVQYIILGTILPANLALATNLILPWFGVYLFYTWLGQVFMVLIVLFSGYAILKHHLFNIKVIATEIFVLATSAALLIRFILSESVTDVWVGGILFLSVSFFGALLVRSVWREIEQREQLQKLSDELALTNKKLKALDQARAEFITMASHQLRTPPSTIKWYLAAILSGDFGKINPDAREALEKTEFTNNSLISLIDDMLNVSRIERGKIEFVFEKVNIIELVKISIDQLMPLAQLKKLQLVYKAPDTKIPLIMADREKIRQVISNLIDNAIKYTKTGHILVTVDRKDDQIMVFVEDTGKGISEEEMGSLFKKFSRSGDAGNFSTGLGLGLYLAKIVVEQHKGRIWAESRGLGKGSRFIFSIPQSNGFKSPSALVDLTRQKKQ